VVLRVQLCSQAAQASLKFSSAKPGRSFHEAKTHLLLALTMVAVFVAPGVGVVEFEGVDVLGGSATFDAGLGTGVVPQETNNRDKDITKLPKMHEPRSFCMGLILLEALLALLLLLLIVWWTMFSGRKKGELVSKEENRTDKHGDADKP
jgi:hypothetical protein